MPALVITACGDGGAGTTTTSARAETSAAPADTTAAPTDTAAAAAGSLLIWADESRAGVLEEISPPFSNATGVAVDIEIVDFGDIQTQVTTQAPAGKGPDIFLGGHDWTGELVTDGILEPIDLGAITDEFFDVSLSAFTFDGQLYAVPYGYEAVALYYNTDLVPEPPATIEDLVSICESLDQVENCLGLPGGGDDPDAYHHYPFISADGGYIFAYDPETGFNPSDVGLDNDGAIQGVTVLQTLVDDGVVGSVNYDTAKSLFLEGSEPFWITGPRELRAIYEQTAIVNWSVAKLPTIDGNNPAPFVGARGFFVSAFSENKVLATSYLLDYVATQETMEALYAADYRLPTFTAVFDAVAADDPVVQTFNESVADGIPVPNIPEMDAVWTPLGDQLLLLRNGEVGADEAMTSAATQVREAIGAT